MALHRLGTSGISDGFMALLKLAIMNIFTLIDKIVVEVGEVGEVGESGYNFDEVTNGDWAINPQTISFNKYSFLLKPGKKVVVHALKFNASKALVAKHVASSLVLFFNLKG